MDIGVVDDDAIVRDWIRRALADSEFRVVGEARTGEEVEALLERRRPALLLIDYRLPDVSATELLRRLRLEGVGLPVLVMTGMAEPGLNEAVFEAGGQGVVLKRGKVDFLVGALRAVANGEPVIDPEHPRRPEGSTGLSLRERQVLRLVATGATNREIANEIGVGTETVKTILERTYRKLGVRNRVQAVEMARGRALL